MRDDLPPLPPNVIPGAPAALNARIPAELHWYFKWSAMTQSAVMADVLAALVTVYIEDPERIDRAIALAKANRVTLGDIIREALDASPLLVEPVEL